MSTRSAYLVGWGAYVPQRVVTNHDLEEVLDTSDEWITTRTGIRERRWAEGHESTGDLAVEAGRAALQNAGNPRVDRLILATTTPDHPCPATAPWVAHQLGLGSIPAYDLAAVCSGFLYGLAAAQEAVQSGAAESVLLIGADVFSGIVDPQDRTTAVIFGDGAGAVVVSSEPAGRSDSGRLGRVRLASDGSERDHILVRSGGAREPVSSGTPRADLHFTMQGSQVFSAAVTRMSAITAEAVAAAGWALDEVDWLVAHQANRRILSAVSRTLGIEESRVVVDVDFFGNTSAASIPLALAHHAHSFRPGDRMALAAFGGGTTWGAATLTWPENATDIIRSDGREDYERRTHLVTA